jgi:tRNA-Thr(GGU) m(6)t(6)A37 methyltransferase TsaA
MAMTRSPGRNQISIFPIGIIRTPFEDAPGTPIQSVFGGQFTGRVIVDERYAAALEDVEGFDRIWLIYWMDRADGYRSRVVPYLDKHEHGLFATRSPCRPNPIGLSVVRLISREDCVLNVADLDILDGTLLLDIKPYVPDFDSHPKSKAGWFDGSHPDCRLADDRFHGRKTQSKRSRHSPHLKKSG